MEVMEVIEVVEMLINVGPNGWIKMGVVWKWVDMVEGGKEREEERGVRRV